MRPPGPVGFVGLGAMGGPMVKRLLAAGHAVTGYNRTRAKAEALAPLGLRVAASPREAAAAGEALLSMVTDSEALRRIAEGPDGVLAGLKPGAVWADMSTVSPAVSRAMGAEVAARGAAFLDAPVSGSAVTVEQGKLAYFVGGERSRTKVFLLGGAGLLSAVLIVIGVELKLREEHEVVKSAAGTEVVCHHG